MSEHSLPPDPASWPRDPFRLLGVRPGASARDLRKAYLRLIRSYKPEHSPEEFQRIRQAYEAALPSARPAEADPDGGEAKTPPPLPGPPAEPPRVVFTLPKPGRAEPAPGPWDLASRGEPEAAYRLLVARTQDPRASEEDYLRSYWLLALRPTLEPTRPAVDWLVRGLGACGADSPRLRELLRRELEADPGLATGDRLDAFLRRRTPPPLAIDLAEARWRAARRAGRWGLILDDVHALRAWLPDADEDAWVRLLIVAAGNLAWADGETGEQSKALAREVEGLARRHRDHSDELYQLEYVEMVKAGLDRLGGPGGPYAGTARLLGLSWDDPGPESRARLRAYVGWVERAPVEALRCFDEIQANAPAVLGRLSGLLGGFEPEADAFSSIGPARLDEVAPEIARFLEGHAWADYPTLRPGLLNFCLREALSPGLVARTLSDRPEFILTGKAPLAQAIVDDWPLRHAYRACELAREG